MDESTTAPRRGPHDWLVDACLFLVAVLSGLILAGLRLDTSPRPPKWLFDLDQVTAVVGCAALWLRRGRPTELAVVLIVLSTFSELITGAVLIALFTVAVHRPPRTTMIVSVAGLVAGVVYVLLRPEPDMPRLALWVMGGAIQGAVVGWGLYVHHRRKLAAAMRERAARMETEARLRAEQAGQEARTAIAREIHDVLGHRLSLLSVHAGALEYHPDAPSEEIAHAARVIRESAHQALQDLREVIGVLRAPVGELPQPTYADLRQLVAESDRAGMWVTMVEEHTGTVPDRLGRTTYRIVQEALTNVRRHARGAPVRVSIAGAPGAELVVEIVNDAGPAGAAGFSGARPGRGLIGLAERVALVEGRLEYGPTTSGGWRLGARLPWPE
ncbi:histidine kinase [Streptosporangium sp. NPDC000239]|uniref:sensor histidine kinase n=1 Tax=Streptosporangium sp. NPDC000239 TaxID=3154248 RepID=UPI0033266756